MELYPAGGGSTTAGGGGRLRETRGCKRTGGTEQQGRAKKFHPVEHTRVQYPQPSPFPAPPLADDGCGPLKALEQKELLCILPSAANFVPFL